MNLQSKFGNFMATQTFNIAQCKRDRITDRQKDGRSDYWMPPADFPGHKNLEDNSCRYYIWSLSASLMRNYFPKRPSGVPIHTFSNLYDVPVGL